MGTRIRKEEYTTLGDFVMTSYTRDLAVISGKFIKLNAAYKVLFKAKLDECKLLDSVLMFTEVQKTATKKLYEESDALNKELVFLNSYVKDAGLNTGLVTDLKYDLSRHNIEGAVLKIEGLRQYVILNTSVLLVEGMASNYGATLGAHGVSLALKNTVQTTAMKDRRLLTDANIAAYDALYGYITNVCSKGKIVYKHTVKEQEYSVSWNINKMRGPQPPKGGIAPAEA